MADEPSERDDTLLLPPRNPAAPPQAVIDALFPHLADPDTYGAQPSPFMTPNAAGKVPAVESDPRVQGALADIGHALTFAIPFGGTAAGAAKVGAAIVPAVMARRLLPQIDSTAVKGELALHNSPFDFPGFDLSKLRTGEGAAGFGEGHYSAEHVGTSGQGGFYWNNNLKRFTGPEADAAEILRVNDFDRARAIDEIRRTSDVPNDAYSQEMLRLLESDKPVGPRTYIVDINRKPKELLNWDANLRDQTNPEVLRFPGILDQTRKEAARRIEYAMRSKYPISPQRMEELGGVLADPSSATGDLAYHALLNPRVMKYGTPAGDARLARELSDAGIPGVQYLDQFSRGRTPVAKIPAKIDDLKSAIEEARAGGFPGATALYEREIADLQKQLANPPTHNFVRFDNDISILRKLGLIGGAIPAGKAVMGSVGGRDTYQ